MAHRRRPADSAADALAAAAALPPGTESGGTHLGSLARGLHQQPYLRLSRCRRQSGLRGPSKSPPSAGRGPADDLLRLAQNTIFDLELASALKRPHGTQVRSRIPPYPGRPCLGALPDAAAGPGEDGAAGFVALAEAEGEGRLGLGKVAAKRNAARQCEDRLLAGATLRGRAKSDRPVAFYRRGSIRLRMPLRIR